MFSTQNQHTALSYPLLGALIGLARATEGNDHLVNWSTDQTVMAGLAAISDAGCVSSATFTQLLQQVDEEKRKLVPMCYQCAAPCGRTNSCDVETMLRAESPIRGRKVQLLETICAAAAAPTRKDTAFFSLLYRALYAIGREDWSEETLLQILREAENYI